MVLSSTASAIWLEAWLECSEGSQLSTSTRRRAPRGKIRDAKTEALHVYTVRQVSFDICGDEGIAYTSSLEARRTPSTLSLSEPLSTSLVAACPCPLSVSCPCARTPWLT